MDAVQYVRPALILLAHALVAMGLMFFSTSNASPNAQSACSFKLDSVNLALKTAVNAHQLQIALDVLVIAISIMVIVLKLAHPILDLFVLENVLNVVHRIAISVQAQIYV